MVKAERSLKSRALQLLAQRDQSRLELRRKLLRHERHRAAAAAGGDVEVEDDRGVAEVEVLLDWLEANGFLSDERFVESRVHARQARFGVQRIRQELAQHAVALPPALAESLAASELERASAVRERRFSQRPVEAADRAAQSRFLLGRGFAPELVQRLMRQLARRGADEVDGATSPD